MKNLKLVISFSFLLLCFSPNSAQIKMTTDGNVTIGETFDATADLEVSGHAKFRCGANSGIYFENYSTQPIILPQWNHALRLGRYDRALYYVRSKYMYYYYLYSYSDINLKENIRQMTGATDKLLLLNPVIYDFKEEIYNDSLNASREEDISERHDHAGFIANEVKEIFPKLVKHDKESDLLAMNYVGLIPTLVKSIQEQQTVIESLK